MLKQARLLHYDPRTGDGFLECLGYQGYRSSLPLDSVPEKTNPDATPDCVDSPTKSKTIYFHSRRFALPGIDFERGKIRLRPSSIVPVSTRPGTLVAYRPEARNQTRAYAVCSPASYLHNYRNLYADSVPCPAQLRFFLSSWVASDLWRREGIGLEASLKYVLGRLRTLQGSIASPECQARLELVTKLFHVILCDLRNCDQTRRQCAPTRLELLRQGLLRYDNLVAIPESDATIDRLLQDLPPTIQETWSAVKVVMQPVAL